MVRERWIEVVRRGWASSRVAGRRLAALLVQRWYGRRRERQYASKYAGGRVTLCQTVRPREIL